MKKIWLLTAANLRKSKGQAASFLFMILIASLLMNIGVVTGRNYDKNYDRRAVELNSADVIITIQNTEPEYLSDFEKELYSDSRTASMEVRPAIFFLGNCTYGGNETSRKFAVLNKEFKGKISQVEYVGEVNDDAENPIYLPYIFQTGGGYELNDSFKLTVSNVNGKEKEFHYTIAGFFEEAMLSTINSSTMGILLGDKEYRELSQQLSGIQDSSMFLVQLKNHADNEAFSTAHIPSVSLDEALSDFIFYDLIKQARTLTSSIGAMIIIAFSIIISAISLIVVKFRVGNSIEEDMRNIGALKAIGYTGRQISDSILLQFLSVGFAGVIAGVGLSYCVLPLVSQMFAAQTGVLWKQGFDVGAAAITMIFVLLAVLVVSMLSAKRARRLQPIVALRSGILTHSFKRNPFPLEKYRMKPTILLSAKEFCQNARKNILVGVIIAVISFAAAFAVVMYDNVTLQFDNFLSQTLGELFSVRLSATSEQNAKELLAKVEEMPEVRKAFFKYDDSTIQSKDGVQILSYVTEDYSQYDNQDMVYQGRFPAFANEVAIGGLLAEKIDKHPGDRITLVKDDKEMEYLITGFIQGSNYLGRDVALTEEGYRLLSPEYHPMMIAVYLNEGVDIDSFMQDVKTVHEEKIATAEDYRGLMESSMGSYREIVGLVVWVILLVTVAITALTMYLVIKTLILRKKRELGIQKAMGYTTSQLVMQITLSFLPVVLLGTVFGCVMGKFTINPLLSVLLSGIGMMKVNFKIYMWMLFGLSIGITLLGLITSAIVALQIRKITPYSLISE